MTNSLLQVNVTVSLLFFLLPVLAVVRSIIRALSSPLRSLPGPFWARFTRLWYLSKVWAGDFEKTNIKLHEIHGPIVRIAPNEYSIDDPESIKIIYGHGTHFIKAPWYSASSNLDPDTHDLFTDLDPKRHGASRRKVAGLYSMTSLLQMEPCVFDCTERLVGAFQRFAETAEIINLQFWFQCYAFDLICLITLNKRFGFLDHGEDHRGLLRAVHNYLIYCANAGIYSEWHPILSRIAARLPGGGMQYLMEFTQEQIQAREQQQTSLEAEKTVASGDFLSQMLHMHQEDPEKFTMVDIFTMAVTNVSAGSDTTSISLSAILYHLIQSPSSLRRVRAEIDSKLEPSERITFKQAQSLPYLQACIKEGLRMHPATGLPLARVVPKGGSTISGTFFPEGTVVGVNSWVAHHNKDVFGSDADTFRPERWLESSAERLSVMERYFMTFGAGSRTCIGKSISLMEISLLIPDMIRKFDFVLEDPNAEIQMENMWFVKQKNILCRVRERNK